MGHAASSNRASVMRARMIATVLVSVLAGGCGPDNRPRVANSNRVVKNIPNSGKLWPVMLQHCLRKPDCDPMSDFGQGAGQASGIAGSTSYYVESADTVREGGEDYGAALTLSVYGLRGQGGEVGRPLTLDESPSDLRGTNARRSTLTIEYRTPGGGAPEPYFFSFRSALTAIGVPGASTAKSQDEIASLTSKYLDAMTWPDDPRPVAVGAKLQISGKGQVLLTAYSSGIAYGALTPNSDAIRRGFEPWWFYVGRNLRDEPADGLLKALKAGESLSFTLTTPSGAVILRDGIYTDGFTDALKLAEATLADPSLAEPLSQRCAVTAGMHDKCWDLAETTPILRSCDSRTAQQRDADKEPSVADQASTKPSAAMRELGCPEAFIEAFAPDLQAR
jgi:hypothetical protein